VQQSGGTITASSALFVGSTFEILLPAMRVPVDAKPATVAPLPATHGSETVLLVEEDEVVRKMVEGILTTDGYRVVAVESHAAAQRELRDKTHRVRLLVANLAGDDEKFARRLRSAQPDLRVICTCGHEGGLPVTWLAPERQVLLAKPYALSDLLKAARRVLDA
jgi:two-component system cell cycle sensor histidine kinase/response regulator CckA